ncbi:MAG: N-acetylglucosamine-6-phosphate deacetylase [Bacillota bacterium]
MMLLQSRSIYTEGGKVDGYLLVEDGRIAAVAAGPVPDSLAGVPRVDASDCRIIPGLIDLHIHGAGGWPVEGTGVEGLRKLSRYLAAFGVTGFLPTASPRPVAELEATLRAVRELMAAPVEGAVSLGTHLEGPYLNPAQKGAMNPNNFRTPSVEEAAQWIDLSGGTIRRMTVAPEQQGAAELIRFLTERGVAVAGGHTDATYAETKAGIDAGIRIANHTYNAMRGLHHREPGALGAYLTDDRVICEVICDFLHVHPAAVELLLKAAGQDRVAVISDAIPAAGMPSGHYQLYGRDLYLDEQGFSKLANGTLAGSTKLMLDGLRNLVEGLGRPWEEAVQMGALMPARAIGLDHRKGSLAPGKDADLVVLGPDWQVRWTLVEGRVVWRPDSPAPELNPAFLAARVSA